MAGNNMEAASLRQAEFLAENNPDTKIKIPNPRGSPPPRYERSFLSINEGATEVYRTAGPRDHFQLRIHDDHWTVDYDQYHPKHYPVDHAVHDATTYTAAGLGLALLGAIYG